LKNALSSFFTTWPCVFPIQTRTRSSHVACCSRSPTHQITSLHSIKDICLLDFLYPWPCWKFMWKWKGFSGNTLIQNDGCEIFLIELEDEIMEEN
jgi:hypothetical protein